MLSTNCYFLHARTITGLCNSKLNIFPYNLKHTIELTCARIIELEEVKLCFHRLSKGVNIYTTTNFPPFLYFKYEGVFYTCLYFLHTEMQLPYVLQILFKYHNHVARELRWGWSDRMIREHDLYWWLERCSLPRLVFPTQRCSKHTEHHL